jgi:hypothetical protein
MPPTDLGWTSAFSSLKRAPGWSSSRSIQSETNDKGRVQLELLDHRGLFTDPADPSESNATLACLLKA